MASKSTITAAPYHHPGQPAVQVQVQSGSDNMSSKKYDLILFGVTGFTGQLAAEYLLQKYSHVSWAACARSEAKAKTLLEGLAAKLSCARTGIPPIVVADLTCPTAQDEETLRALVQQTHVVLTTAGPFEKYGLTLHRLCAEQGTHYADITGETSFVRRAIAQGHDALARQTNAMLVSHCGNDCVPHDVTVYEMYQHCQRQQQEPFHHQLQSVVTYNQVPSGFMVSGGTLTTALYQLSKKSTNDNSNSKTSFDPLLQMSSAEDSANATKSPYETKITHKRKHYVSEFASKATPYIMAPVMANCVRRSNALLGYNAQLEYGDALLEDPSWWVWTKRTAFHGMAGAAYYLPRVASALLPLPQPGQGPPREELERGFLTVHGRGSVVVANGKDNASSSTTSKKWILKSTMHFGKDVAYLMTAQLLVECGMLLLGKAKDGAGCTSIVGGVQTPAIAFGSDLLPRILRELDVTWNLEVEDEDNRVALENTAANKEMEEP